MKDRNSPFNKYDNSDKLFFNILSVICVHFIAITIFFIDIFVIF